MLGCYATLSVYPQHIGIEWLLASVCIESAFVGAGRMFAVDIVHGRVLSVRVNQSFDYIGHEPHACGSFDVCPESTELHIACFLSLSECGLGSHSCAHHIAVIWLVVSEPRTQAECNHGGFQHSFRPPSDAAAADLIMSYYGMPVACGTAAVVPHAA